MKQKKEFREIYIDNTETFLGQYQTGIQRVVREMSKRLVGQNGFLDSKVSAIVCRNFRTLEYREAKFQNQMEFDYESVNYLNHIKKQNLASRASNIAMIKLQIVCLNLRRRFVKWVYKVMRPFWSIIRTPIKSNIYLFQALRTFLSFLNPDIESKGDKKARTGSGSYLFMFDAFWNNGISDLFARNFQKNGGNLLVLVHDLLPVTNPEFFEYIPKRLFKDRALPVFKSANILVFTSQTWFDLAESLLPRSECSVNQTRIVCTLGADRFSSEKMGEDESQFRVGSDQRKHLIMIGTIEPRKNYSLVIKWFMDHGYQNYRLTIVGRRGWIDEDFISLIKKIQNLGIGFTWESNLDDRGLSNLISRADAGICASFNEGFGLPLIEMLTSGLPVIASDIAIFREVNPGGIFFDPYSIISLDKELKNLFAVHSTTNLIGHISYIPVWDDVVLDFATKVGSVIR